MDRVHIDMRKWPNQPHWQYDAIRLGEDEHGVWLLTASGTSARRGHEPRVSLPAGFVQLVPRDKPWIAEFYQDHDYHAVYVNIGTFPEWHGDRVHQIDLDLDVIRQPDGSVKILDEDEFLDHQRRFHYPRYLIADALAATEAAVAMVEDREEPFDLAAEPWLDSVDPRSLQRFSH